MRLFKNLYRTFLGQLSHPFLELFTFHRIFRADAGKEFRWEHREVAEGYFVIRSTKGITYAHSTGIKNTDNVAGIGFVDNRAFRSQELLRLRQANTLFD